MAKKRRETPFEERKFYFKANFKSAKNLDTKTTSEGVLIEGYANTVDLDRGNDVVEPRAFEDSIASEYKNNPIILFQHDHYRGIGRATELRITERGLYVKALIFDEEIKKMIENGVYRTFSIGYRVNEEKYYTAQGELLDPKNSADLQRIYYEEGVKRVITKLELYEISVVSVPMNATSLFDISKSIKSYFDEKIDHLKNTLMEEVKIVNELKSVEEAEEVVEPTEAEGVAESAAEEVSEPSTEDEVKTEEAAETAEALEESEKSESVETDAVAEDVEKHVEVEEAEEVEAGLEEDEEKSAFGVTKDMLTKENLELAVKTVQELKSANIALEAELKEVKELLAKTPVNRARLNVKSVQFDEGQEEQAPEPKEEAKGFKSFLVGLAQKNQ